MVIVDEASLISDIADDSNYYQFGSGKLLCDLIAALNFTSCPQRKLIFCGDPAQLPPVKMSYSPVFSFTHLQQNYGMSAISSFMLREVVRQKGDSTILRNATQLRDQIELHNFTTLQFALNKQDCQQLEASKLVDSYLQYCSSHRFSDVCIVTATNASALAYNAKVRARRDFSANRLQHNDLLIISRNNYNKQLFNGDFALVDSVSNEIDSQSSFFTRRAHTGETEQCPLTLYFQSVTLMVHAANNTVEQKQVLLLLNFLFENDEGVTAENLTQAMITNGNMRFAKQFPSKKKDDFDSDSDWQNYRQNRRAQRKEFMLNDSYLNCVYAKFGYAITCHKAQSSEWPRVYVDCSDHFSGGNKVKVNEQRCRWLYTAITRAKHELILINPPHITLGQRFRFTTTTTSTAQDSDAQSNATLYQTMAQAMASQATVPTQAPTPNATSATVATATVAPPATDTTDANLVLRNDAPLSASSTSEDYFETLLRTALRDFAITCIDITDAQYLKTCTISTPESAFVVNVYYNGKSRITKVYAEAKAVETFAPQLQALQQQLLHKSILPPQATTITPESIQVELNATTPELQDIGKRLCEALAQNQLALLALKANNQYSLRFEVQTQEGDAHGEFDLFWGKKGGTVRWVQRHLGSSTLIQLQCLVEAIISKL